MSEPTRPTPPPRSTGRPQLAGLNGAFDGITPRRIGRAAALRLSRMADRLADRFDDERKLRCNACSEPVAVFVRYAGKPNRCPRCGSSAKERLVLALLDGGHLKIDHGSRCLHIAPSERQLLARFTAAGPYVAADLHPRVYEGRDVRQLDLTELTARREEFGTFDLVYASHVLEHVPDDAAAFAAIRDGLNPGGQFWMLVPLADGPTVDGDGTESVQERERRFGQWDHVRQYGDDVADRLTAAGFQVDSFSIADLDPALVAEAGLAADDVVWACTPAAAASQPTKIEYERQNAGKADS